MQQQIKILVLVALFSAIPGYLAQSPRDIWLKIERKGTAYASQHLRCTPTETGGFCYETEQRIKMDVVGTNPQEIQISGRYWVTANLEPISFEFQTKSLLKEFRVTGKYENEKMFLTLYDNSESPRTQEISFKDTYFDVVLEDFILKHASRNQFSLKLFDSFEQTISECQIHVDLPKQKETEGINATVSGTITQHYQFNPQGQLQQIHLIELGCRAFITTEEDAKKIETLKTDDGFTLTIPTNKDIGNIDDVQYAKILMKWKNIPIEQFAFNDNRQRLVEKKVSGAFYEAILEVKKPPTLSPHTKFPVLEDAVSALFLTETDYIKPFDPAIQKQLADIRGSESDTIALIQKILDWISKHIEPEMIIETLSGPEVLKQRKGKCSEYAILFASLTRSAGIPTKMVLGERHLGSHWMGHMWNEVWLGEWISVDPSQGAFISSPSLLKFIEGPTVESTQAIRMKLIDNLSLEILEFTENETASNALLKTGIQGNTYSNKHFSCTISAPDSDWEITEESQMGSVVITLQPKHEKRVTVALVLFSLPDPSLLPYILEMRIKAIEKRTKDFKKLKEGTHQIAGSEALKVIFQQNSKEGILLNENYLLAQGKMAYLLVFIAPEACLLQWKYSMHQILEHFKLIK